MLYFDTHAHYDWEDFYEDRRELFDKFNESLCGLVNIGINLESAKKVKEYTVKVQSSIMLESVVDAAKDAMDIYEKYISKVIKG